MTAHELLKRTLARIEDPKRWVSGVDLVNERGEPTTLSGGCSILSLQGALRLSSLYILDNIESAQVFMEAARAIHNASGSFKCSTALVSLATLSHSTATSHEECLRALREAIAATAPKPKKFEVVTTYTQIVEAVSHEDAIKHAKEGCNKTATRVCTAKEVQ